MSETMSVHQREFEALDAMSVRELIAELKTLQDRQNFERAASGYRPIPGQMHRRAVLERRERQIVAELTRRHAESRAQESV